LTLAQASDNNQATGAFNASGNQNSDFAETMKAEYVKQDFLYTLVVGGFGRHFFYEQVSLESLEYPRYPALSL